MRASSSVAAASACAWRAPVVAAAERCCTPPVPLRLRLRLSLRLSLRSLSSAPPRPLCPAHSLRPTPLARRCLVSLVVCALPPQPPPPPPPPGDPGAAGPAASSVDAAAARDVAAMSSAAGRGGCAGAAAERVWLSPDLRARVYLLLVPFMWGTYGPALRFIYSQPHAPSASIITLSRKLASVVFFLLLLPLEEAVKDSGSENHHNGSVVCVDESKAGNSWGAASELGFWTFLGTALQTNALGSTTATRAGFILQTITVLVPLISAVSGSHVSKVTWGSAFLALMGVVLMSAAGSDGAAGGNISSLLCSDESAGCQSALMGDLEVLAAAFFYAINTIRLGVHAKTMSALELSTRVMVVSTACTSGWAAYDYAAASLDGRDGALAWQGLTNPQVIGTTVFAALVPGTLAHLAQAVGQKTIPPSEAQVYYSLQPVWAALFSAILLHESMSPLAWGAGCLIVFAALLAGTQNSRLEDER